MEFNKIEILIEKYFQGETSIAEEKELRSYFSSQDVAPHLEQYKAMFGYFTQAEKQEFLQEIPQLTKKRNVMWLSVAASIVVLRRSGGPGLRPCSSFRDKKRSARFFAVGELGRSGSTPSSIGLTIRADNPSEKYASQLSITEGQLRTSGAMRHCLATFILPQTRSLCGLNFLIRPRTSLDRGGLHKSSRGLSIRRGIPGICSSRC